MAPASKGVLLNLYRIIIGFQDGIYVIDYFKSACFLKVIYREKTITRITNFLSK